MNIKQYRKIIIMFLLLFTCGQNVIASIIIESNSFVDTERIYEPSEVDRKAKIIFKPEPPYTRQARERCVSGKVVLRLVLSASGEVGEVTVVKGMTDGLTEQCVKFSKNIKFEPAVKDGQKVSQYIKTEYNFICQ